MEISERLLAVMRYKNLSGKDLAEKLHVQRSAISHIMLGRNKPSIDFLERFIVAFPDINIQWFISGKGAMLTENSSASTHKSQNQEHSLFGFTDVNSEKPKPLQVNSDDSTTYHTTKSFDSTTAAKNAIENTEKQIERIILIYTDGTFETMINRKNS